MNQTKVNESNKGRSETGLAFNQRKARHAWQSNKGEYVNVMVFFSRYKDNKEGRMNSVFYLILQVKPPLNVLGILSSKSTSYFEGPTYMSGKALSNR